MAGLIDARPADDKKATSYSILEPDTDLAESPEPSGDIRNFGDNYHSDKYYYILANGQEPSDLRRSDESNFGVDKMTSVVGR